MKHDVVGPHPDVDRSPVVEAVLAALDPITADAEQIDVEGVTRDHVDGLAATGFVEATSPPPQSKSASAAVGRELNELLAAASGALWFVMTQHRSPTEVAASTTNPAVRDQWAQSLSTGEALGAVSFAHLRRPGFPAVRATADGDGWRIEGRLDWVTSWGLADVLLLMSETVDGKVVQAMIPAKKSRALVIGDHLPLAAMAGTSTVGGELNGLRVTSDQIAAVLDKPRWAALDSQRTADASPAVFGVLRAMLTSLEQVGQLRGAPEAVSLAHRWSRRTREIRSRAYALMDGVPPTERVQDRVLLRAEALHLAQQAASALVAVSGGKAMLLTSPPQRWAREALFYLVQAQTLPLRQNLLALYNRPD